MGCLASYRSGSSLKRRQGEHRQVSSWLVSLDFRQTDCPAPKPDVVGSSPTAPVIMYIMGKVDFGGFSSGVGLFFVLEI